jgi:recombination protein RecA
MLDLALNKPGLPGGRIVEYYGFEATGKTTAALHAIGSCQKIGGLCHFIDTEKHWDAKRAAACGVDPNKVLVTECDSLEAIYRELEADVEWLEKMKWKKPFLSVVDSATAVLSENEFKKEIGEEYRIGQDARVSRTALRKLNPGFAARNMTVIFVNHAIAKISAVSFGKKSMAAGGHAVKFYSSVRVEFSSIQQLFDKDKSVKKRMGQVSSMNVEKNKVARTGQPKFNLDLVDNGFDIYMGLWEAYKTMGLLTKVNTQTYFFKPAEAQMTKKDFIAFIDSTGGPWDAYKGFLMTALESGAITPYGGIK